MIKVITNGDNSILELEVGTELNEEDYEKIKPELEETIKECGEVDLLIRMEDVPSLSIGAMVQEFNLSFRHLKDIGRIAVVGDSHMLQSIVRAEDFIPGVDARYFDFEDVDGAWEWLKG